MKYWVGERICLLRSMKRLTQGNLSAEVGISQGYLSKLEQGRFDPGFHLVLRIARVLGCTIQELAEGDGPLKQVTMTVVVEPENKAREANA